MIYLLLEQILTINFGKCFDARRGKPNQKHGHLASWFTKNGVLFEIRGVFPGKNNEDLRKNQRFHRKWLFFWNSPCFLSSREKHCEFIKHPILTNWFPSQPFFGFGFSGWASKFSQDWTSDNLEVLESSEVPQWKKLQNALQTPGLVNQVFGHSAGSIELDLPLCTMLQRSFRDLPSPSPFETCD